jgi:hypothetical protein
MAYLDDNPPVRSQFRLPRREDPSGVAVVHTAENTPDYVAFDGGAESVANFIRNRTDPGSYHELCDSDSAINLVRYDAEAYHDATGSNPHSFGVSAATRADVWPLAPPEWRNGCIRNMALASARYAAWCRTHYGIMIPARRITRAESEGRVPGFISHAERDPERRTDPGRWFPWDQFLDEYARLMAGAQPKEWDEMATQEEIRQVVRAEIGRSMQKLMANRNNTAFDPNRDEWLDSAVTIPELLAQLEKHIDDRVLRTVQALMGRNNALFDPAKYPWLEGEGAVRLNDLDAKLDGVVAELAGS